MLGARLKMFASRDLEAVYPYCTEGGGMVKQGMVDDKVSDDFN